MLVLSLLISEQRDEEKEIAAHFLNLLETALSTTSTNHTHTPKNVWTRCLPPLLPDLGWSVVVRLSLSSSSSPPTNFLMKPSPALPPPLTATGRCPGACQRPARCVSAFASRPSTTFSRSCSSREWRRGVWCVLPLLAAELLVQLIQRAGEPTPERALTLLLSFSQPSPPPPPSSPLSLFSPPSLLSQQLANLQLPSEAAMSPRDKYTMFSRKDVGYRKGIHKSPHYCKVTQRVNPQGF